MWDICDDRLQHMALAGVLRFDESLLENDVSRAWMVWSGAAETALDDAYCFAGGPVPIRGLVLRRGSARIRVLRFGGPKVRKARGNVADVHEAGDVFMCRDSSIAPLLDLRRRLKAVMDVLDSMIRSGVSLPRSLKPLSSGSVFLGLVLL